MYKRQREFRILKEYYDKELHFTEEELEDLKAVTGEYGSSCAERLGLPAASTIQDMLDAAFEKIVHWREKENALFVKYRTKQAIRVVSESYHRIHYHVEEAQKHLYFLSD